MPSKRNVSYHAYNAASPMNNRKLAEFDCLLPVGVAASCLQWAVGRAY